MGEMQDEALLARVRGGDDEAVSALVRRYQPSVYRFSLKMCRRPEDAEDVSRRRCSPCANGARVPLTAPSER